MDPGRVTACDCMGVNPGAMPGEGPNPCELSPLQGAPRQRPHNRVVNDHYTWVNVRVTVDRGQVIERTTWDLIR